MGFRRSKYRNASDERYESLPESEDDQTREKRNGWSSHHVQCLRFGPVVNSTPLDHDDLILNRYGPLPLPNQERIFSSHNFMLLQIYTLSEVLNWTEKRLYFLISLSGWEVRTSLRPGQKGSRHRVIPLNRTKGKGKVRSTCFPQSP